MLDTSLKSQKVVRNIGNSNDSSNSNNSGNRYVTAQQEMTDTELEQALMATKTVILDQGEVEQKRAEILEYFHKTFTLYESIFECLANDEVFYQTANPLRHPLIFYYGHTAVFFINKLNVAQLIDQRIDPTLESMLAIGVDEMSWDDVNSQHYDWPSPQAVKAYRRQTRELVDQFIQTCDFSLPIQWDSPMWIIMMGIEHERIHLETTSVLIRELPMTAIRPHAVWGKVCEDQGSLSQAHDLTNALMPIKGGVLTLGKGQSHQLYGWDNEYGQAKVTVADFKASQFLVSNQAFLDFVNANGYQQQAYWSEEGWQWKQFTQSEHPVYWLQSQDGYLYRTMIDVIDMPWDWPVEVNYHEAAAYCAWYSEISGETVRLPTEAEWYQMRNGLDQDQPDWLQAPGNINLEYERSSCPINRHLGPYGLYDVLGNVWQWTQTAIDGFPGFKVHTAYDDFSTPTFDGLHAVFKGGSWISTGNLALRDARYAFRRHFFQHAGFRYVAGPKPSELDMNVYETSEMLAQYIEFHYGEEYLGVHNYPVTCAEYALAYCQDRPKQRALDLGCATGRAAFELATQFRQVDAVDFSANLIAIPITLQQTGLKRYVIQDEGELVQYKEIKLAHFPEYETIKDRVTFLQGDACNLAEKFTDYDLVFAGNLLDRLYDPAQFLEKIQQRVRLGGLLVLTSPYTWLTEFTPRDKWLGGFKAQTGESFTTLDGLQAVLQPKFELVDAPKEIPFVIRETKRKFQHSFSQMTVWRRQT